MVNASIKVKGIQRNYEVTKVKAHFKIMLPSGNYSMEVVCHDYEPKLLNIVITRNQLLSLNVTLSKLTENNSHGVISNKDAYYETPNTISNANITSGIKGGHFLFF